MAGMHVYKSRHKEIEIPHLDILSLLFGKLNRPSLVCPQPANA